MRVVSGKAKGRKLLSVPGTTTRPILDRVKTSLFDSLQPIIADISFLDLFAGSGAVGIEALSRGAKSCLFVDVERSAIQTIIKNLEATDLATQAQVRHTDAFKLLKSTKDSFDLIYIAPPQYKSLWVEAMHAIAERPEILRPGGLIICQIDPREYEKLDLMDLDEDKKKEIGNTLLAYYVRK
ncbi:MAG: 16S rRNA (guanine(966)-N(2))-methyltransferase RsmD [Bdellovibrionales bacterium]|nr:16S rRNA (guanine(966)-N(2))-methyltransferase RsmD [Bdellovibrionales bacterium]